VCVWWQMQDQHVSKSAQVLGRRDNVDLQTAASICTVIISHKRDACTPESLVGRRDNADLQVAAGICTVTALHTKSACTPQKLLEYHVEHDNIDSNHKQLW